MFTAAISLVAGLALLVKGADWLVDGASAIARRFGVSDLAIGLTIVAFGTSTPELIVNIVASINGSADIAIGNVLGSNICNILLILGIAAMIAPLAVQRSTVLKEIPFSLLAAVVLLIMANDMVIDGYARSELSRSDGIAFVGFFIIFLYYTFGLGKNKVEEADGHSKPGMGLWKATFLFLIGLGFLCLGGSFAVDGATIFATMLGVSEALIGLTVVAVGTSLPELAASSVAAYKGNADIAVGNIVGSNIFNIFWILGISAIIKPLPFRPELNFDLWMVVASTVLLFVVIHNGHMHRRLLLWWKQGKNYSIRRWEGAILFASYIGYVAYIVYRDFGTGI